MTDWAKDDLMDPPYAEDDRGSGKSGGSRLIRHGIALALVVVAIAAMGYAAWFGYKTWRAQGSEGLAPVIQADAGPTRVRPEQPGGIVIPHQDRLILNDLNGGGASVSAESLLPPPEEPLPRPTPAVATAPAAAAPASDYTPAEAAPVQTAAVATPPPAPAPAPEPTQTVQPVAVTPPVPQPSPVAARDADDKVPAVATPPAQVAQAAEPAPELITRPAAEAPAAPEFVSVGNLMSAHRVQLAAVDSEESARRAWLRYQGLYQDVLGNLSLLVQQVEVNNRTYFRVQGGPLEADSAGRICQTIKSRGADCLVVRPSR